MEKKFLNFGIKDENCETEEEIIYDDRFDDMGNIEDEEQDEFVESISM